MQHTRKKSAKTVLPCWSTYGVHIVLPNVVACSTLLDRKKRDAEKTETVRKAKADPNYLENYVKKIQREAEERRRALRGLS